MYKTESKKRESCAESNVEHEYLFPFFNRKSITVFTALVSYKTKGNPCSRCVTNLRSNTLSITHKAVNNLSCVHSLFHML